MLHVMLFEDNKLEQLILRKSYYYTLVVGELFQNNIYVSLILDFFFNVIFLLTVQHIGHFSFVLFQGKAC